MRCRLQSPPEVLAIAGPTAVGKSAVAHAVARAIGAEIVVADPFQRYRGLEIAADSPTASERAEVRYHLVGDLELHEASSAGEYAPRAHAAIDDILTRGRVPIVSGGTGLYLRAALAELRFPPQADPRLRDEIDALVATDLEAAVARLEREDPAAAARVDTRNPRRVARALVLAASGIAPLEYEELWTETTRRPTLIVGLSRPRERIDALIATRVRRELDDGLVEEITAALSSPAGLSREAGQIIGVSEVRQLIAANLAADALPDRLAARTRKLARAQLTWLRKTPGVHTVEVGDDGVDDVVAQVAAHWRARAGAMPGPFPVP